MCAQFAAKTFLRQVRPAQFLKYFQQLGIEPPVDLSLLKHNKVEPAFAWLKSLTQPLRSQVERDFCAVSELANASGIEALLNAAKARGLDWSQIFADPNANHYHRSFFAFLFHRDVFDAAACCHGMDRISGARWRRRLVGRGLEPATAPEAIEQLRSQIQAIYLRQGRGRQCHIDYYRRADPDRHCFFAYPEDHATSDLSYDRNGEFGQHIRRPSLEVVFVYRPDEGLLEIAALGGKQHVTELAAVFCGCILDLPELPLQYPSGTIELNHLLSRDFDFPTEPSDGIDAVMLRTLELTLPGGRQRAIEFRVRVNRYDPQAVLDLIHETLDRDRVNLHEVTVTAAHLTVLFAPSEGSARGKRLAFSLRQPDTCSLKDHPHDQILKRCLRRWDILRDSGARQAPWSQRMAGSSASAV